MFVVMQIACVVDLYMPSEIFAKNLIVIDSVNEPNCLVVVVFE